MGWCPHCETELNNLQRSETTAQHIVSAAAVWECPECGVILGVSDSG
ncbi:hypothetical protein [Haloprofundus marisrubri]|nr:hypothetical protein [Haloprofundus marisrubri]